MQRLKKILATLIAAAMLVSSFAACAPEATEETNSSTESSTTESSSDEGSEEEASANAEVVGNTYVTGLPIAVEPISYTVFNQKSTSDYSGGQNDKEIMQLSTEGTNVSIEFTETTQAAFAETLSLMLATGDGLPDAIHTASMSEAQVTQNLSKFWVLTEENLRTFAPNITTQLEANVEGGLTTLEKADGNIYSLPVGAWSEYGRQHNEIVYLRKEWVDALGMEVPSTMEELYELLVAFKNDDPNGNGEADEIPYIFQNSNWLSKLVNMAGPWGIAGRNLNNDQWFGRVEDGEYILNITDQRFYDFLAEMNRWSEAGLMNQDGFSIEGSAFNSIVQQEIQGMYGTWAPPVEEWESGVWTNLPVLSVEGYEGQELKAGEVNFRSAAMNGFTITSACEEPEGLLRWWDNVHSETEWKLISRDGPEDLAWEYGEDGTAYVKTVDPMPAGLSTESDVHYTYGWRGWCALLFPGEAAIPNPDTMSSDGIRYEVGPYYEDYFAEELIPVTAHPVEAADDFALTKSEIENAVQTFMASSVVEGISEESWNEYIANLEALGLADWVTYYQCYVSGDWTAWDNR